MGEKSEVLSNQIRNIFLFPNPFREELNLYINRFSDENLRIILINTMGQEFTIYENNKQRTVLKFNLSKYPPGIYFVKIIADADEEYLRLIKI